MTAAVCGFVHETDPNENPTSISCTRAPREQLSSALNPLSSVNFRRMKLPLSSQIPLNCPFFRFVLRNHILRGCRVVQRPLLKLPYVHADTLVLYYNRYEHCSRTHPSEWEYTNSLYRTPYIYDMICEMGALGGGRATVRRDPTRDVAITVLYTVAVT